MAKLQPPKEGQRFQEKEYHNGELYIDRTLEYTHTLGNDHVFSVVGEKKKIAFIAPSMWVDKYEFNPSKRYEIKVTLEPIK